MAAVFEKFAQTHDPEDREDWTFPFRLSAGESIASATIEIVDSTSTDVDADTDLEIEAQAFGQISGTLWGVTAWISGGSPGDYFLRCTGETNSSPIARKFTKTMKLVVAQR